MEEWNIIECRQTEYVSPLVIVRKKDGCIRVCLDARFLNNRMVKDHVNPPNPTDLLFEFTTGQVLSSVDLTASYWQIKILPEHQKYTGFSFDGHTYVFKVLPFGLSTSVGSFIRCLTKILGTETNSFVIPYVDDLLIFSKDFYTHMQHLRVVFQKFREAKITIKLSKSKFVSEKIKFLGHIISDQGVEMDPERIRAIKELPAPTNITRLRSFLGLVNYDHRFCRNFSALTVPLLRLLKKGQCWKWGQIEIEAFEGIKSAFLAVTMLKHPNVAYPFYIQTDASSFGLGAILYQTDDSGNRNVIAYASRTLKPNELPYTVTEKELLAIVYALRQWVGL